MPPVRKKTPDFFSNGDLDPVSTAIGSPAPKEKKGRNGDTEEQKNDRTGRTEEGKKGRTGATEEKKKVGFYLPADLIRRFDQAFFNLKAKGSKLVNKSAFLEYLIEKGLGDLDEGDIEEFFHRRTEEREE